MELGMSYCRWSCDNWKSDVYVYESNEGFMTHVATNRVVGDVPEEPDIRDAEAGEWIEAHRAAMVYLETAERRAIGLPSDGKTFVDDDAADCAATLLRLREQGYHIPQHSIDGLLEEATEPA